MNRAAILRRIRLNVYYNIKRTKTMITEDEITDSELLLQEADFLKYYKDMAHPNDYKIMDKPIEKEFIFHQYGHHNRLIHRISWKINNGFIPMSFVCNTGSPMYFYLCPKAIKMLKENGRIKEDDLQSNYVE